MQTLRNDIMIFLLLSERKFNGRVQKVSIDAGFTCPNKDGSKGVRVVVRIVITILLIRIIVNL